MDTKLLKKYCGLLIIIAGIIIYLASAFMIIRTPFNEYMESLRTEKQNKENLEQMKQEEKEAGIKEANELAEIRALKPVYKSPEGTVADSTEAFGTMFDEVIKLAQQNALMIRSIEYNMNPTYDTIFATHPETFSVCEFKFFFVGTYNQFRTFLYDINNKFPYFIAISKMDVTSFSENPEYLLIKISFTMYAEKPKQSLFSVRSRNNNAGGEEGEGEVPEEAQEQPQE